MVYLESSNFLDNVSRGNPKWFLFVQPLLSQFSLLPSGNFKNREHMSFDKMS